MYVFTEQRLEDSLEPSVLKQETVVFVYLRIFRKFHIHENLLGVSGLWGYQCSEFMNNIQHLCCCFLQSQPC